jgi:uncharacterized SAM-binding protein YcdF (DUF218 family)
MNRESKRNKLIQNLSFLSFVKIAKRVASTLTIFLIIALSIIPIRLAIASIEAPQPQAIFILGGNFERSEFAARLWKKNSDLNIWISDFPLCLLTHQKILEKSGVPGSRIILDSQAVDTVTNFTTLVDKFKVAQLKHIYLVTSTFHMSRAKAIASIVLGSNGITFTPFSVPAARTYPEPLKKVVRDSVRAIVWIVTGKTGARFNPPSKGSDSAKICSQRLTEELSE